MRGPLHPSRALAVGAGLALGALGLALTPTSAQDTETPIATSTSSAEAIVAASASPPAPAALEVVLGPELLAIGAVALEERIPEAWWSDTTDGWPLEPARQRRRMPRRCRTRGGYRELCSGERIVPEPTGVAAAIAERFSLGERGTAMVMMHEATYPEWLALVAEDDPEPALDWPVPGGHRGRGFGYTRTGELSHRRHQGIDIGAPEGTPVHAARGGLVVYSDNYITGYGNMVIVLHADGVATFYGHCRATLVAAGEHVERGDVIAEVGETGFAPAPHLHFEWRRNGHARDPSRHFRRETMHTDAEPSAGDTGETEHEP